MSTSSENLQAKHEQEKLLWHQYKKNGCEKSRQELIVAYQPLVYREVGRLSPHPRHRWDLFQEGCVGLIEAVEAFDPERGCLFSTFASYRILGRLLNYLTREKKNTGGIFTDNHVEDSDLENQVEKRLLVQEIKTLMERLPAKEKLVLKRIFLEDRPAQEVAEGMSITTSYLYRLRKKGIRRLRGILGYILKENR